MFPHHIDLNRNSWKYFQKPINKKMITSINEFKNNNTIETIKNYLIGEEYDSWNDFVDSQELGDCQSIVASIKLLNLPGVVCIFGEIEVLEPTDEEYFNKIMTHHHVMINGESYEFSKGTLKDYVNFNDLYSIENDGEIEYL